VTRRTPHPLYGCNYELQTFECRTCGYETERSADRSGLPHLSDAAVLAWQMLVRDLCGDRFGINRCLENLLSGLVEDRNIPRRIYCGGVN